MGFKPLTKNERHMMDILWEAGRSLKAIEILELAGENRDWKDKSLYPMINSLLDKGYIEKADYVPATRSKAHTFRPTITPNDYSVMMVKNQTDRKSIGYIGVSLVKDSEKTEKLIDELKAIIDEYEQKSDEESNNDK